MVVVNFIYFWFNMVEFLENVKNPRTGNSNWNDVWWMIFPIDWGLMIVRGAETKRPRVFFKWIKKSWSLSFVFLPVEAGIEFDEEVFPVVFLWLFELQRPMWKVYEWSALHELAWITLPKSTCISWKWNFESWVRGVTVSCWWSASCLWCSWMVFGCLELKLFKPKFKFEW